MWRSEQANVPVRRAMALSVRPGLDIAAVRDAWDGALDFLTGVGHLVITVNKDARGEIRVDWHAVPSEIEAYMRFLQRRDEYGGCTAHLDVYEEERLTASQRALEARSEQRMAAQADVESGERLARLQPRVCSLEGLFEAAELGHIEVLKAMIRGYPLPIYDPGTGTFRPNLDRRAVPEQKHVLREQRQLSHTASARQHTTAGAHAAGDAHADLLQAAPFLVDAAGKLASSYELRDAHGKTPMHVAAAAGQHLVIELLLEEGCDPNAQDRVGLTPLHLACLGGHKDAVRALFKGGAQADLAANDGRGVVHCVAIGAHKALCEWLLLDKEMQDYKLYLQLERRLTFTQESVLHVLSKADANTKEKRRNVLEVAKVILKAWSFLNNKPVLALMEMCDVNGLSPLHVCAASDSFELMRYFSSRGLSPNIQAASGDIALHIAVRVLSVPACTFLISAGTDVAIANADGDTPLHIAASMGDVEIFKLCFQACPPAAEPPVSARFNKAGDAPIHVAARRCDCENALGLAQCWLCRVCLCLCSVYFAVVFSDRLGSICRYDRWLKRGLVCV